MLKVKNKYSELFVEFDRFTAHIDVHLVDFDKKSAGRILDNYIKKYDGKEIHSLNIIFWEKGIAGDYLSYRRKNSSSVLNEPLSGIKYFSAVYNYSNTSKEIGNVYII